MDNMVHVPAQTHTYLYRIESRILELRCFVLVLMWVGTGMALIEHELQ